MKNICGFQYHPSFMSVELEKKEFAIFTPMAFLPTDGGTYNLSVVSEVTSTDMGGGHLLTVHLLEDARVIDIGLWKGHRSETEEFCRRANALIKLRHRPLPP